MSEQFAIQPEEFDSTNERLDSILDRLNALGKSATDMKVAPLRPLESVPTSPEGATSDDLAVAPDGPAVSQPALGLVPPLVEDELIADDDLLNGEAFDGLETIDTGADFESVTTIEPEVDAEPLVVEDQLAPAPMDSIDTGADASSSGWVEVGNYDVVESADVATVVTDEEIAADEAAMNEGLAAEFTEVSDFDTNAAELVSDVEPLSAPSIPLPELPTEPQFHETAFSPSPSTDFESQVFELDKVDPTPPPIPERPDAPTSIFGSSLGDKASTIAPPPIPSAETDSGWVSHDAAPEESTPFATLTGDSDAEITEASSYDSSTDPQWSLEPPIAGSIFDQDADAEFALSPEPSAVLPAVDPFDAPQPTDPFEMADEVEQTLGAIDNVDGSAVSPTMDTADLLAETSSIDLPGAEVELATYDDFSSGEQPELYDSDEDLPLPDFTGVYDPVLAADGSSASIESGIPRSLSVGRKELDSLRPEEDPEDSVMQSLHAEKRDLSSIGQFAFVVFVGLAALVMYWVLDPNALADMRNQLDSLLGR